MPTFTAGPVMRPIVNKLYHTQLTTSEKKPTGSPKTR